MNYKTKDFLALTIFKIFSLINRFIPKKECKILLYSNTGFRDNVAALYEYLITNNYNQKYKIMISADKDLPVENLPNVFRISTIKGIIEYFFCGHVFYSQGKIPIYPTKGQKVVQMWHGTPFKGNDRRQKKMKTKKPYYTNILSSSPYFNQIIMDNFFVSKENVSICGQPRTDIFFETNETPIELKKYSRIILWMPTHKMSKYNGSIDVKQTSIIPIFTIKDYDELEKKLSEMNICLLIKLHPLQDMDLYKDVSYEYIFLLKDDDFRKKGWDLYRLMSRTDALITDYSSVFYDYMLLDRPIGYTIDDFEEYKKNRGFVVDNPDYFMAGEKIRTKDQFYLFLKHVAEGTDKYKDQRNEVNRIVHTYFDNQNCKRALEIGGVQK